VAINKGASKSFARPDDHLTKGGVEIDVVQLGDEGIDFAGEVSAAHVFVDGSVGDVGIGVLRDRRVLAEEGVVVAVVTVDGLFAFLRVRITQPIVGGTVTVTALVTF